MAGDPGGGTPIVEIQVAHERGPTPSPARLRDAVEVFTRNHIYVLDSMMRCVDVRTLRADAGRSTGDAGFVGWRLVGGQANTEEGTELSYPFPRPGAQAVFEVRRGSARQFHYTSPVTKVVVRLSIVTVTQTRAIPTWEEISRALDSSVPPSGKR
jgi:hypothetical protein